MIPKNKIQEVEVFIEEIVDSKENKQIDAVLEILNGVDSYDNLSEKQIDKIITLRDNSKN